MPLTVREQVIAALLARLQTIPGVTVERERDAEVTADLCPLLVALDAGQGEPERGTAGVTEYALAVEIEAHVTAASGAAAGAAINDLYGQVLAAIAADETLGGVAVDAAEGALGAWVDHPSGADPVAGFKLEFTFRYWTKPRDPFTPAP